ncbi:MAG TPA: trehalose-phosphatase [Candidatus Altiarchaeales archaeon]|nr:trehalose-phosphatase [Candidatus Altiarchaeales archaeon]
MKHALEEWDFIESRIFSGKKIILLLDYDGTLTHIVENPGDAVLDGRIRSVLREISGYKQIVLGVLSGRRLADVMELVGVNGIYYCGNHGLEVNGPGTEFMLEEEDFFREKISSAVEVLRESMKNQEGVSVEDKGLSVVVHYRRAVEEDAEAIQRVFMDSVKKHLESGFRVCKNKKTLELLPDTQYDKGTAVVEIKRQVEKEAGGDVRTIYVGDDATDEDAFRSLGENDVGIVVGRENSCAKYFLLDVSEVWKFLDKLRSSLQKTIE